MHTYSDETMLTDAVKCEIMQRHCGVHGWRACSDGELWVSLASSDCVAQSHQNRDSSVCTFLQQVEEPTMSLSNQSSMHTARNKPLARWPDHVWQTPANEMPHAKMKCWFYISLTSCIVITGEICFLISFLYVYLVKEQQFVSLDLIDYSISKAVCKCLCESYWTKPCKFRNISERLVFRVPEFIYWSL